MPNSASHPTPSLRDPRSNGPKPPFLEKPQSSPGAESSMVTKPDHGEESYVGHGRLQGRSALVTGADSGIGRAVALAFAREGADVAVAYLGGPEEADARATKALVESAGRKCVLLPGDLVDPRVCASIVDGAIRGLGKLDVLVNNAAYQGKAVGSIEELAVEDIERVFRVNIMAMFHVVKRALPSLPPGSSIINTASVQAYKPSDAILAYATTKGAIVTFTKGLALETIERGIRVNAVAPGPVWTPLTVQSYDEGQLKGYGERSPMSRPAQPKEMAPAYVFLASNESTYVNGAVLGTTGGTPLG
jgi:NAD(P)-dependent dehydrogenase (short-subunit alcohol dehydrogenase family)